jgi:hypothetical protein
MPETFSPAKPKSYMPQVNFQLSPVLLEGDIVHEDLMINIVDVENSWTVVQIKKCKNKMKKDSFIDKCNKQQRDNLYALGIFTIKNLIKATMLQRQSTSCKHFSSAATTPASSSAQPVLQQQPATASPATACATSPTARCTVTTTCCSKASPAIITATASPSTTTPAAHHHYAATACTHTGDSKAWPSSKIGARYGRQ